MVKLKQKPHSDISKRKERCKRIYLFLEYTLLKLYNRFVSIIREKKLFKNVDLVEFAFACVIKLSIFTRVETTFCWIHKELLLLPRKYQFWYFHSFFPQLAYICWRLSMFHFSIFHCWWFLTSSYNVLSYSCYFLFFNNFMLDFWYHF